MNILPTKHIPEKDTLLYSGAIMISELTQEYTVSELWEKTKDLNSIQTFDKFVATLDFLFILGLVDFKNEKIIKVIL